MRWEPSHARRRRTSSPKPRRCSPRTAAEDCWRGARLAGSVSVADQAWALLLQLAFERVHAHFAAAVAELDLAPVQARALHELDLDPPISMRELAQRLKS